MVTAGDTIMIHKDDLLEGENIVELTVFGRLGGRVVMTSTLMIGTIDNIDQTGQLSMRLCMLYEL